MGHWNTSVEVKYVKTLLEGVDFMLEHLHKSGVFDHDDRRTHSGLLVFRANVVQKMGGSIVALQSSGERLVLPCSAAN